MSDFEHYFITCNGLWAEHLQAVKESGFDKASPLARLIYSCEIGEIDQHASEDLKAVSATVATLQTQLEQAEKERDALKAISEAALKWRSEWPDQKDVTEATEEQCPCAICQLILACDALKGDA